MIVEQAKRERALKSPPARKARRGGVKFSRALAFRSLYYPCGKMGTARSLQSTPDNSNLQGKSKTFRVIGSSKNMAGSEEKNSFYCTVNILII